MDTSCAIKATAHQLARLVYNLLTKKQAYVEQGLEEFEARSQDRQVGLCFAKPGNWGINWWPLECLENNGLHFV